MAGINNRKLNRITGLTKEIEVMFANYNTNHPIHEQYIQKRLVDIKRLVEEIKENTPRHPGSIK